MCSTCILSFIKMICVDDVFYMYIVLYKSAVHWSRVQFVQSFIKVRCTGHVLNMYTVIYKSDVHCMVTCSICTLSFIKVMCYTCVTCSICTLSLIKVMCIDHVLNMYTATYKSDARHWSCAQYVHCHLFKKWCAIPVSRAQYVHYHLFIFKKVKCYTCITCSVCIHLYHVLNM